MVAPNVMLLKGGFTLQLPLAAARATQDIDLRVAASAHNLAGMFAQIADAIPAPDDFLRFEIRPHVGP